MIELGLHTDNWRTLSGSFETACDAAVKHGLKHIGVIVNVEPHGPYTTDVDFMRRLFETIDSEYLRLNMDTGNTFIAGLDPVQYMRDLLPYLSHMHIKDVSQSLATALRGEETGIACSEVPIGGGVNAVNIKQCIELLQESGWSGAISIECNGADHNIRDSVNFLRSVLDSETVTTPR